MKKNIEGQTLDIIEQVLLEGYSSNIKCWLSAKNHIFKKELIFEDSVGSLDKQDKTIPVEETNTKAGVEKEWCLNEFASY